jgi:excisionase family DNA binding protein
MSGGFMNYPDLPHKNHLLVAEAARFLGVSEKTVRRWHHAGLVKGTRLNGSLRIDRKSLLVLIDKDEREQDRDGQAKLQGS